MTQPPDDRAFWIWRRENPRLAVGVTEDAFWDIFALGGATAISISTELAGYEETSRRLTWFFERARGNGVERHEQLAF